MARHRPVLKSFSVFTITPGGTTSEPVESAQAERERVLAAAYKSEAISSHSRTPLERADVGAALAAAEHAARYRHMSAASVLDELLVWSQAANEFASAVSAWSRTADARRWRLFVAHEAALVEWAGLLIDGEPQAAGNSLRAVISRAHEW